MNVADRCIGIAHQTTIESWLPNLPSNLEGNRPLERMHDARYGSAIRYTNKEVHMIGHYDKRIEKKWIDALDPVEALNDLSRTRWIYKDGFPIKRHRCHEHETVILNAMILRHALTVSSRRKNRTAGWITKIANHTIRALS